MKKKSFLYMFLVVLVVAELFLRFYLGLASTILFDENPTYEYLQKPDQDIVRFRKRNKYNTFSMRSDAIDKNSVKILGFGDSVLNGGVLTDQDSLATTLLSKRLSKEEKKEVQFLNISAGSWGPDNCYAYLTKFGNFNAKTFVLFVSSHDAYDNRDFQKVVGVHPSYPSENFSLASVELVERYLLPKVEAWIKSSPSKDENLLINKKNEVSLFNSGFQDFYNYTKQHHIKLIIYLHPDAQELEEGKYNSQGQEIIKFAQNNNILLIKELENGIKKDYFRDEIHLNSNGQRNMYNVIMKYQNLF